jgi:hypothetical protein
MVLIKKDKFRTQRLFKNSKGLFNLKWIEGNWRGFNPLQSPLNPLLTEQALSGD